MAPADPPTVAGLRRELAGLRPDHWALVLPYLRGALQDVDDTAVTTDVRQLRATPTGRLASGRNRDRLIRVVTDVAAPLLLRRLSDATAEPIRALLVRAADAEATGGTPTATAAPARPSTARVDTADASAGKAKARIRELRGARDEALRQLRGAEARLEQERTSAARAEAALVGLQQQVVALAAERDRATLAITEAVARAERRSAAEIADLRAQLREVRRAAQDRADRDRRRAAAAAVAERAAAQEIATRRAELAATRADRTLRPGRPTALPEHLRPETGGAARALLGPGRAVFVDGYNVTKSHRPELSLEHQRAWLTQLLDALAARARVEITLFLDATEGTGSASRRPSGVVVRYTDGDLTADDEIEFEVAALPPDRPILVVTDDRELRARVTAYRADVIGTQPFLHAAVD